MQVNLRQASGPVLEKPGDLAALLTNLQTGDVLFVDEIHRLSPVVEEVLYPRPSAGHRSTLMTTTVTDVGATHAALAALKQVMETPSRWRFNARLEPGWGLVSNNLLHTRTGFVDGKPARLFYRARYYAARTPARALSHPARSRSSPDGQLSTRQNAADHRSGLYPGGERAQLAKR
jgi:hypothetical protein